MKPTISSYWQGVLEQARTHIPGVSVTDQPTDDEAFEKALDELERDLDSGKLEWAYTERLKEAHQQLLDYERQHQ